ncbi:MAG: trehalose operon repressor [Enterococcus sp.]
MKSYEIIYHALEQGILKGNYPPETYLPSETMLCQVYAVSRDTVRKSLALLMANGYIQKIQGKGSLVLKREQFRFPLSGLTSYKELQNSYGYQGKTRVVSLTMITITQSLAQQTGLPEGAAAWDLLRTREIEGAKIILDRDLFLCASVPTIDIQIAQDSIYHYFEETLQLQIAFAEKEIIIDHLTDQDREFLDLNQQDINIVSVASRVFLANATQFQYTESRHRVDKFRFYDFARRNASTY